MMAGSADTVSKDPSDPHGPTSVPGGRLQSRGTKRSRTGCLTCRAKRRKCDEKRPVCSGCRLRGDKKCEWGVKLVFRDENAQTLSVEHRQSIGGSPPKGPFRIVNVTAEVARDYIDPSGLASINVLHTTNDEDPPETEPLEKDPSPEDVQSHSPPRRIIKRPRIWNLSTPSTLLLSPYRNDASPEDGVFIPGSEYQEAHATLRSRLMDTARSTVTSRRQTPEIEDTIPDILPVLSIEDTDEESRRLAHLTRHQEYKLWQNYIFEVAPWLDKFDNNRHFEMALPSLARDHTHLKYAILALSARQIELKSRTLDLSCSLALYQHAIHLLSPLLYKRTTVILASSVILCVLEMLSCAPKAWRRHLDGCAALIQALGISGTSDGLEQSLFFTFTRMDVCGGLISSEKTLIPAQNWIGGLDLLDDLTIMRSYPGFDMYGNQVVYLCGQVIDLLASSGTWDKHHRAGLLKNLTNEEYTRRWTQLWGLLQAWNTEKPSEMQPIMTIPAQPGDHTNPFSIILYGNGPAISGNQMYHCASLLMLKNKPASLRLASNPPSMLWHARQICAISMSNNSHACWTNSIQPIWIAGQLMSHPNEHKAILAIYKRIERETGWTTQWRVKDLLAFWAGREV